MAYNKKKYKCDRKVGANILGREKSAFVRRQYPPGQHGRKHGERAPRKSEFKLKLNEKTKLCVAFGIRNVSILKKFFNEALRIQKNTNGSLHNIFLDFLERRLVMVVYRSKLAASPESARQLVSHKNVLVNGKVVHSINALVEIGDVITLKEHMLENSHVVAAKQSAERTLPDYLEIQNNKVTLKDRPTVASIPLAIKIDLNMIVELLSA